MASRARADRRRDSCRDGACAHHKRESRSAPAGAARVHHDDARERAGIAASSVYARQVCCSGGIKVRESEQPAGANYDTEQSVSYGAISCAEFKASRGFEFSAGD